MSFDYNAPAELFLSKFPKNSRAKYRLFTTAAEAVNYAVEDLGTARGLGAWLQIGTSASTATKSNVCMKAATIRCAKLSKIGARSGGPAGPEEKEPPLTTMHGPGGLLISEDSRCCLKPRLGPEFFL